MEKFKFQFRFDGVLYTDARSVCNAINGLYHDWNKTGNLDKVIENKIDLFEKAVVQHIYDLLFTLTIDNANVEDKGALAQEIFCLMYQVDFVANEYEDKAVGDYDLEEGWIEVAYYFKDRKDPTLYYGMSGLDVPYSNLEKVEFFAARAEQEMTRTYKIIE